MGSQVSETCIVYQMDIFHRSDGDIWCEVIKFFRALLAPLFTCAHSIPQAGSKACNKKFQLDKRFQLIYDNIR